jgi:hypothetical protein
MAGLVPAIHVFLHREHKDVDARDEPANDKEESATCRRIPSS